MECLVTLWMFVSSKRLSLSVQTTDTHARARSAHTAFLVLCCNNELSILALPFVMREVEFPFSSPYFPFFVGDEDYMATFNHTVVVC